MDREKLFLEYLATCMENLQICGQGNPDADILIIGQEQSSDEDLSEPEKYGEHLKSLIRNYDLCIRENLCNQEKYSSRLRPKVDPRTGKKIADTWLNYQKLIASIYPQNQVQSGYVDFENFAFTTELGNKARKHSVRDSLTMNDIADRLVVLKQSEYIQSFPIVILACSDYIRNNEEVRDNDKTFHVEFCKEYGKKESKNRFWTHIDKGNPKRLVIHTRQFSNGISNDMIKCIACVIRTHIDNHLNNKLT